MDFHNQVYNLNFFNRCISVPSVNSFENNDSFEIDFAVPGMNKDDFSIELDENILKVSSEKSNNLENEKMKHLLLVFTVVCVTGFTMAQTKVASVNSQGLLDSLPSYLEAQKTLEEIRISGLTELQEMEANLNKAIQNFREKEKDMAPVVRDLEEKKLMQKDQEIQTKQQSLQP